MSFLKSNNLLSREIVLRQLSTVDAGVLSDLHATGFDPSWGTEDMFKLLQNRLVFGFLASERSLLTRERPLGFVLVRRLVDEAEVLSIAVHAKGRGRGIGSQLMREALRTLYAERISRLFLEVDENNHSAVMLYRRLGFVQIGERKGYYSATAAAEGVSGKGATALVMSCQIL